MGYDGRRSPDHGKKFQLCISEVCVFILENGVCV